MSTVEQPQYRIHSLRVQNVLQVECVEIEFDESGMMILAGPNGAGKSSVIHAAALMLDWRGESKKLAQPILRKGKKKGESKLVLNNGLVIRRQYTEKDQKLTVERGGVAIKSPQSFLDTIRPPTLLDPLEFSAMTPAARRLLMIEIGGLGDELDGIQAGIERAEEERRDAGRESKRLEVVWEALPDTPDDTPDEEVSIADLADALECILEERAERERAGRRATGLEANSETLGLVVVEMQRELEEAQKRLEQAKSEFAAMEITAKDARAEANSMHEPDDDAEARIRAQISGAEAANRNVRIRQANEEAHKQFEAARKLHETADETVDTKREARDALVERVELPLKGLGFDAEDATFNGVRCGSLGTAEKIIIGLELGAAQHPGLLVFGIHRGESLDAASFAAVEKFTRDKKAQVLMEVVGGEGRAGAFVIEAGRVKEGREDAGEGEDDSIPE